MLTSVRSVACNVARLDDIAADLLIEATRVSGDSAAVVYAFSVRDDARELGVRPRQRRARRGREWRPAMRRALVTGGSGGIGAAVCKRLAAGGCHVLVHANRNIDAAQSVVDALQVPAEAQRRLCSMSPIARRPQRRLPRCSKDGPIQILVNNAGIHDDAVFPAMRAEQWDNVIDVSLNGFFNVTQPLLMPMLRTRWGRIVNVTSVAAILGNRGQVNYAAAKGALHAATKSLALEVASRGVTVNAVAPGIIDTSMSKATFDKETIERLVPMKRAGKPEEVADLIGFLCSDGASYMTGQIISVNGGIA
jgi:3-oxoacyl-[acyl-carrier protein] reductase